MEEIKEKNFEFRKLKPCDLFLMTTIISKIGINEFSKCFSSDGVQSLIKEISKNDNKESEKEESKNDFSFKVGVGVALEISNVILSNLPKCEKEIYQMLANVSNKKIEDIKDLDIDVFAEMIIEFVKKDEFKDFFKVASKFIK